MDRVHDAKGRSVNDVDTLAIAIYENREHIGLLHRVETNASDPINGVNSSIIRLLHWGWHNHWGDADTHQCAFWVSPALSVEQKIIIAGHCRLILKRNAGKHLAFGFATPYAIFDEKWELEDRAAYLGVTCATFVLAIFHRAGFPLLKYETWKVRDDDKRRFENLLKFFSKTPGAAQVSKRVH